MSGSFYRLTRKDRRVGETTKPVDWRLPYKNSRGPCAGAVNDCHCHAYSLIRDLGDVERARHASPWVRGKSVARIDIDVTMGVLEKTRAEPFNTHYDWWPSDMTSRPEGVCIWEPSTNGASS